MEYGKPPCGNTGVHAEHWVSLLGEVHCPGWSEAEAATAELIDRLNEMGGRLVYDRVPAGVRLECHPSVVYTLQATVIPGYQEFISGKIGPQFPVVALPAMKHGEWRLVVAAGEIPASTPARQPAES